MYEYRHENKYLISKYEADYLISIFRRLMQLDPHNNGSNGYEIRSLYLDTFDESMYEEGLSGVDYRNKYRFRIYDYDTSFIKFERKETIKSLKRKYTSVINKELLSSYLEKHNIFDENEAFKDIKSKKLIPKIVIDYNRIAFVGKHGNIRITFDSNIRYTNRINDFFRNNNLTIPLLPNDVIVLEIKYNYEFPRYLAQILDCVNLTRSSFSKYILCMENLKNNGMRG